MKVLLDFGRLGFLWFLQLHQVDLGLQGHLKAPVIDDVHVQPESSLIQVGRGHSADHGQLVPQIQVCHCQLIYEVWNLKFEI